MAELLPPRLATAEDQIQLTFQKRSLELDQVQGIELDRPDGGLLEDLGRKVGRHGGQAVERAEAKALGLALLSQALDLLGEMAARLRVNLGQSMGHGRPARLSLGRAIQEDHLQLGLETADDSGELRLAQANRACR